MCNSVPSTPFKAVHPMTTLQIAVAAHRPYAFPSDPAYLPIQVGKAISSVDLEITGDDSGDHISARNPSYCELTAAYWSWKNAPADISGLVHYRRYFRGSGWNGVATSTEIETWLENVDVVVARPRNYYIESVRSHYANTHYECDLDVARTALATHSPEYVRSFDSVMKQRHLSLYNMMIARRDIWDEYCNWLFPILEDCYDVIDWETYNPHQRRVIGYLAELLLNVWLVQSSNRHRILERPVVNLEGEPKFRKGLALVGRRLGLVTVD